MNQLLIELKEVISFEITAYKELLALSRQKKTILVNNNVAELNDIVLQEQNILSKIKQYETQRNDSVTEISKALGLEQPDLDFNLIIELARGTLKEELIRLRAELKEVISALSSANLLNKTLLDTHMKYIAFCMEAMTSHLKGLNTYSASGQFNDKKVAGYVLMDRSV